MKSIRIAGAIAAALAVAACGQSKMVQTTGQMRHYMLQGNYEAALGALRRSKKTSFKEQDRVVYWMNEGMLLHLLGRYKKSNAVLQKADKRAAELFTVSISKNVKAAFTSQAATDYAGEDYEKVLINALKAINYLALGKVEEALVEARKINEKLVYYNSKYEKKNVYNQDAFAHWLMGLLFEMEGNWDDARIAYMKALETYRNDFEPNYGLPVPSYLGEDLMRVVKLGGDKDLVDKLREEKGIKASGETAKLIKTHGEIVFLHLNGEGPSKSDYFVTCWFRSPQVWACDGEPGGEFMKRTRIDIPPDGTVVKIAFPELHIHEPRNQFATISVGDVSARTVPAYPLSEIAEKTLADKTSRIFRNAIIRMITKTATQVAAGEAGKKAGGALGGWLAKSATSAAMQATEEADKRAWTTLPGRIGVARAFVEPGTHTIKVQLPHGRSGTIRNVKVEAGKRVIITYRTIP